MGEILMTFRSGTSIPRRSARSLAACLLIAGSSLFEATPLNASDHLDSPLVIANPSADIGDLFAWMSPDARRLNLVMTIVGHSFSDRIAYVLHIDSARKLGPAAASLTLTCRFANSKTADCVLGNIDRLHGDPGNPRGIESIHKRLRLFAGLRDDPFFNNVRGTRAAYTAAQAALDKGAGYDESGCPHFSSPQTSEILGQWRQTDGGPATNFLKGWTPSSIVASIDVDAINGGGPLLAVWATTTGPAGQIDRAARPLTANALLATLGTSARSNALKISFNRSTPAAGGAFVREIAKGVALYDGLDGHCGDSMLIDSHAPPSRRYEPMARLLADDRIWINSRSGTCTQLFAVERAALNGETKLADDCGGRTVNYDSVNVYRSLLANGTTAGIDDGLRRDEKTHSITQFPFLAPPDPAPAQ